MAAVTAISSFAVNFSALGNYATIQACIPQSIGSSLSIPNPAIFNSVSGVIYANGSFTGGALFLQVLCADGNWRNTTATTLNVTTTPTFFWLLAPSTFETAAIGPVYGARYAITTAITGSTVAYAELTGILAQA